MARGRPRTAAAEESKEPAEWVRGSARGRETRERVAEQLSGLIVEADGSGSRSLLIKRLARVAEAQAEGDRSALRAAVMELTLAGALWAVALDLEDGGGARAA